MNAKTENRIQQNHFLLTKFNEILFYKNNENHPTLSIPGFAPADIHGRL